MPAQLQDFWIAVAKTTPWSSPYTETNPPDPSHYPINSSEIIGFKRSIRTTSLVSASNGIINVPYIGLQMPASSGGGFLVEFDILGNSFGYTTSYSYRQVGLCWVIPYPQYQYRDTLTTAQVQSFNIIQSYNFQPIFVPVVGPKLYKNSYNYLYSNSGVYSGVLTFGSVLQGTVQVFAGFQIGVDDRSGGFVSTSNVPLSGSIDYLSGAFSISLPKAYLQSTITIFYQRYFSPQRDIFQFVGGYLYNVSVQDDINALT